jgi:hypothetical protein
MTDRAFAVWLWCGAMLLCATWFVFGYLIGSWS